MPTYKNNTASTIVEQFLNKDGLLVPISIAAGATLATQYVLTDANLTKTSDSPYYNPLYGEVKTIVSSGVGDPKEADIHIDTKELAIWNNNDCLITMYLNVNTNDPPLKVYPYSEKVINCNHNIEKLIMSFSAAATIYIEGRK